MVRRSILAKIIFEIRMYIMDSRWRNHIFRCWEMYPPSFYYRYSSEEQAKIMEKDLMELREMLNSLRERSGC